MAVIAFVGYGALGAALAEGLAAGGRHALRAYLRTVPEPGSPRQRRLTDSRIRASEDLGEVLNGADCLLIGVPGSACLDVASRCSPHLATGALYVDLASAPPESKRQAAKLVSECGGEYVDGAVVGTVVVSGHRVPVLASGPGAERFRRLVVQDGLRVQTLHGPPGVAATVKLLRSSYLKGRDALIVQLMLAARRHGLEEVVIQSIDGPGERVPFRELVERVLCSLAVHADRRSEELGEAGQILEEAGLDPSLAREGARTLRDLAALGLADVFGGERPGEADVVLSEIDARWAFRRP